MTIWICPSGVCAFARVAAPVVTATVLDVAPAYELGVLRRLVCRQVGHQAQVAAGASVSIHYEQASTGSLFGEHLPGTTLEVCVAGERPALGAERPAPGMRWLETS